MIRRSELRKRVALAVGILLTCLCGACTRPVAGPDREAQLAALDPEPRRLFNELARERQLLQDAKVLALGDRLLDSYPDHPLADVVVSWLIPAAVRLGDYERARALAVAFPRRFPDSPLTPEAMLAAADGLAAAQQLSPAVEVLGMLAAAQRDSVVRQTAVRRARPLVSDLNDDAVRILAMKLAATPLEPLLAARLAARQARPIGPTFAELDTVVRVGVLAPVTGRYARFGNAFHAGVSLAAAGDLAGRAAWQIFLEDTEGDVVTAALAARRLCVESRCHLLIGALLSATTATAALVADHYGVPLISPAATNERLGLLSDQVLQTNLTGHAEADMLARLATQLLLKERFAVIRPDSPEGASQAAAFIDAVSRSGGRVVREEVFNATAVDFRAQIQALRAARPEVVFAPATVDQMTLLGPQLDFYQIGALIMGPSDWNSARLLQRAGSVMEQALCAGSEVVYPPEWPAAFAAAWPADQYDEETTRIARGAYLAARLARRSLAAADGTAPRRLRDVLRDGFSGRNIAATGTDGFSATIRMVADGELVPFPGYLYAEALRRQAADAAAFDSSDGDPAASAVADSLDWTRYE